MIGRPVFLSLAARPDGSVAVSGKRSHSMRRGRPEDAAGDRSIASASWEWDGMRLEVRTSYSGLLPLFYIADRERCVVSNSLSLLRRRFSRGGLNRRGIALLLTLGYLIDTETQFEDVHAMPLRATLTWEPGEVRLTRSWQAPEEQPVASMAEARQRYVDALDAAMDDIDISVPYALGLSGGSDSRHLLLALLERGHRPARLVSSRHYLKAADAEVETAGRVADRAGLRLRVVDPDPNRARSEIAKNRQIDFITFGHSWMGPLLRALDGPPRLYDGLNAGGLFFDRPTRRIAARYGSELPPRDRIPDLVAQAVFDGPAADAARLAHRSLIDPDDIAAARRVLLRCVERVIDFPNPAQAYYHFEQSTRNTAVATYGMTRNREVVCPFDVPDFVDFALALPWWTTIADLPDRMTAETDLQDRAIADRYPEYADIPLLDRRLDASPPKPDTRGELRTLARVVHRLEDEGIDLMTEPMLEELALRPIPRVSLRRFVHPAHLLLWDLGEDGGLL